MSHGNKEQAPEKACPRTIKRNGMELRICPECNLAFYAPVKREFLHCSHCSHPIRDRRRSSRTSGTFSVTFSMEGTTYEASVTDRSTGGARIRYYGPPLPVDSVVRLDFYELGVQKLARTVWSEVSGRGRAAAGLRFL